MEGNAEKELSLVELLVRGQLLDPADVEDAMRLAESMSMPLVRVLETNQYISKEQVEAGLELRSLVIKGQITRDIAFKALRMVSKEGVSFSVALARLRPDLAGKKADPRDGGLAELLMASGAATKKQVEKAFTSAEETGLSVGRILLYRQIITRADLKNAFTAHRLTNSGAIDRDHGITALRVARLRSVSLKQAMEEQGFDVSAELEEDLGPGEFLVMAGALPESQLLTAKEIQLLQDAPLEELLLELGYTKRFVLDGLKVVLEKISNGELFDDQANRIIQELSRASSEEEANEIMERIEFDPESFEEAEVPLEISDILVKCGLLAYEDLDRATEIALERKQTLMDTLYEEDLLSEEILDYATYLKTYLDHNLLKQEQAIIVLAYCVDNQTSVEETLDAFGW